MEWDWKVLAGFWGAALATLNTVYLLMSKRPVFLIEPSDSASTHGLSVVIRIINPSDRALQVNRVWTIGRQKIGLFPKTSDGPTAFTAFGRWKKSNRYYLLIAPHSDGIIQVNSITEETSCIAIVRWHRQGFIGLWCIKLLRISYACAEEIELSRVKD